MHCVAAIFLVPLFCSLQPKRQEGTQTNPYEAPFLANELFGSGPSTLSAYYREGSYGNLLVDGEVKPWKRLTHDQAYYAGGNWTSNGVKKPCLGICRENSKIAELVEEAVGMNDDAALWGRYDNDGPDDKENTFDDDGKVDFVVIVHPGKGAECQDGSTTGLWSHQDLLSNWPGHRAFTTKTTSHSRVAGNIQVDDYVLVPSVACDGTTPIQIGVIAHEFGHSLGLPDLYDTSQNPRSEGVGNWDLMAGGSWGGDGQSPDIPVQLSAWSKAFLGWAKPKDITNDLPVTTIRPYETHDDVYLITIRSDPATNVYYLASNRQRIGFDAKLPGTGLFILRVNEGKLKEGIANNDLNTDPKDMGVAVVEADGLEGLIHHKPDDSFRGGAGDTFPGESKKTDFDNTTNPATPGLIAVCGIKEIQQTISIRVFVSQGACPKTGGRQASRSASINELLRSPSDFVGMSVLVQGLLRNDVSNYFRDRPNLKLHDTDSNALAVAQWLPKEIPPDLHGTGPPVLSQFLGHEVELVGTLRKETDSDKYVFYVNSARILH